MIYNKLSQGNNPFSFFSYSIFPPSNIDTESLDIWGLPEAMADKLQLCVICADSSPCFKCQISKLTKQNFFLKQRLQSYEREVIPILNLDRDYRKYFTISNKFIAVKVLDNMLSSYKFLTITFDPTKFGHFNNIEAEKNYILYTLRMLTKTNVITQLSGCFEFQKNGTTHAHVLIRTSSENKKIEELLRPHYTDNKRNVRAIQCVPARFPTCIQYMKKESDDYFALNEAEGLDVDIVDATEVQSTESKIEVDDDKNNVSAVAKRIKLYEQEILKYRQLIEKEKPKLVVDFEPKQISIPKPMYEQNLGILDPNY